MTSTWLTKSLCLDLCYYVIILVTLRIMFKIYSKLICSTMSQLQTYQRFYCGFTIEIKEIIFKVCLWGFNFSRQANGVQDMLAFNNVVTFCVTFTSLACYHGFDEIEAVSQIKGASICNILLLNCYHLKYIVVAFKHYDLC